METINFILSLIGGTVILIPAASFLTIKLLENRLNKDIESYKATLKAESEIETEKLKAQLQVLAKEREITVNWLHQKRATAIEELFSALVDLRYSVRFVLSLFSPRDPKDIRKRTEDAVGKIRDVYVKYNKARIFLNTETCKKIDEVLAGIEDPTIMYFGFLGNYDDDELHTLVDVKDHAWKELQNRVIPAMEELEKEFRHILGVEFNQRFA